MQLGASQANQGTPPFWKEHKRDVSDLDSCPLQPSLYDRGDGPSLLIPAASLVYK